MEGRIGDCPRPGVRGASSTLTARSCGPRFHDERPYKSLPSARRAQPLPLEAVPVPHRMVELKQFVIPPRQINVTLFRRRTIGIEHYIDEGRLARPAAVLAHLAACVEQHFVLLKSGRQLPDDALRPIDD